MKIFAEAERKAARSHAVGGGQALLLCGVGRARLYDQDLTRLIETARGCGMPTVRVVLTGTREQHVEIIGAAADKAKTLVPVAP